MKVVLDVDSLIRPNPLVECGEDEGVNDQAIKVVNIIDIIDIFRLQVSVSI